MTKPNHKAIVLHGIRWSLFTSIIRRLFSLILLFFLAQWLSQEDFGIFRTYSLILLIASLLAVFGLDSQFITNKRHPRLSLFALTQFGLLSSMVLSIVLSISGKWIGSLYNSTHLGTIIQFSSGFVIVEVLRRIVRIRAQALLKFKDLAIAETLNVIFYSVFCVGLIFFFREVWIYILLFYGGNLAELIYLYFRLGSNPHRMLQRLLSFRWLSHSLALFRRNFAFSLNVSLISLVNNLAGNAPILFLGTLVAPSYMGLYYFATQLVGVPVNMFTASVGGVFFPTFARTDLQQIRAGIARYSKLSLSLGTPLMVFYAFALNLVLPLLLGSKWAAALPLVYYLIVFYGTSLLNDPISSIPFICRKPHWELIWNIVSLLLRLIALYIGIRYSFNAAILAFSLVSGFMNIAFYVMSLVLLKQKTFRPLLQVAEATAVSMILYLSLSWAQRLETTTVLFAVIIFALFVLFFRLRDRETFKDLLGVLRKC